MKVRLLKDARINHKAGEIVEVSPAQVDFLLSVNAVELCPEKAVVEPVGEAPEKRKTSRKRG